jgi:hypothetical protein
MRRSSGWLSLVHPLLFAALPVLSLLSYNINDAAPVHALRPSALALLGGTLLILAFRRIIRDPQAASLLASVALMLFFSYGHVYLGLLGEETLGLFRSMGLVGRPAYLGAAWLALFALAAYVVLRAVRFRAALTRAFAVMAAVATAFPLREIVVHEIQLGRPWSQGGVSVFEAAPAAAPEPPDIYLFVLDGYGRADVLRDIYNFDNSEFLDWLQAHGFRVAGQARSNYTQTSLSVASMLNMSYLDDLDPPLPTGSFDRTAMARLVRWSAVRRFLEGQGYAIVGLPSGYRLTELDNADYFQREPLRGATTLERLALETSGLVLLQEAARLTGRPPLLPGYRAHRERLQFVAGELERLAEMPGPKFVFTHLLIPHPPFVFDATGAPVDQRYPFTLLDGDAFPGTPEEYLQGYRDQVTYVNGLMRELIEAILGNALRPPVIILHGDHGPGSRLDWQSAERTDLRERSSILSAYYLPGAPTQAVYDTITPVNSFRLVLDWYFDTELGLLPDRSYYSTWERPYAFIPIGE